MKITQKRFNFLLIITILLFISQNAFGYVDPGTGSYVLQIIIAGVLAAGFGIKMFWRSIVSFFSSLFSKSE